MEFCLLIVADPPGQLCCVFSQRARHGGVGQPEIIGRQCLAKPGGGLAQFPKAKSRFCGLFGVATPDLIFQGRLRGADRVAVACRLCGLRVACRQRLHGLVEPALQIGPGRIQMRELFVCKGQFRLSGSVLVAFLGMRLDELVERSPELLCFGRKGQISDNDEPVAANQLVVIARNDDPARSGGGCRASLLVRLARSVGAEIGEQGPSRAGESDRCSTQHPKRVLVVLEEGQKILDRRHHPLP